MQNVMIAYHSRLLDCLTRFPCSSAKSVKKGGGGGGCLGFHIGFFEKGGGGGGII